MERKDVAENVDATMKSLNERVAMLEEQAKMGKEKVETFTKANPLMALGIALVAGYLLGKMSR